MSAPPEIDELVERYRANRADYEAGGYKEARVRREFIDPFFRALGWDVDNIAGYAEAYKDVVHEDALRIGSSATAPDYSFRVGGNRRFFVEAKKPSVYLKEAVAAAYQLRRYAWSAKLPLSILTDFAEFAVYDCRFRPDPTDKASVARIMYLGFEDYQTRWDEIAGIFSKYAVYKGSFDRFAEDTKTKRGTAEVDAAFLADIEQWREALAHNIVSRNKGLGLSQRDLNFAVQATIDRIIFLRICEDRGLEGYGALRSTISGGGIYTTLISLFREADSRYNSGLFHFDHEKGREEPDGLTPLLTIDDKVLKPIIEALYYPASPYEFTVLSADILGRIYEQFLGKVVAVKGAKVYVEEKPEVRKAGGVYYTPTFIVNYIVQNTLGPLLEGKKVGQAASIRVVDPACGSGSFLIAAYQYLLDWHLEQYLAMKRRPKRIHPVAGGTWRLNLSERKRILLNNIFGVDIDPQAVEVTKLSLLLKVIEGETQLAFTFERLLPDLGKNIQCGNSLIDEDFYDTLNLPGLDEEASAAINAFDWQSAFPEVFEAGGFDAVIGNPPYLNVDDTWGRKDLRLAYLKRAYSEVYNDKTDIYYYFLARATKLTKCHLSFIVSRAFLEAFKADKLRAYLGKTMKTKEILDLRNAYVFEGVGITTAVVHFTKSRDDEPACVRQLRPNRLPFGTIAATLRESELFITITVPQSRFGSTSWIFPDDLVQKLLNRIDAAGEQLGNILHIGQGMQTGANRVFGRRTQTEIDQWYVPPGMSYVRARNSDIQRYHIQNSQEFLLYTEKASSFEQLPEGVREYLVANRAMLEARAAYKRGNCEWWQWTWPLHKEYLGRNKLYCPYLATTNRFALDRERRFLGLTDTTVLFDNSQPEDIRYILGLLNSRLLTFRFRFIGKLKSVEILEYFANAVSKLPIRHINPDDVRHQHMVNLVDSMISMQEKYLKAHSPMEKAFIRNQITSLDRQIDRLTFDLYGITQEEEQIIDSMLSPGG